MLKRYMSNLAATLVLSVLSTNVSAIDENNDFKILGIGSAPCEQYVDARRSETEGADTAFAIWFSGFTTAHNLLYRDTYDFLSGAEPQKILAQLQDYCDEHPQRPFAAAALGVLGKLHPERTRTKPAAEESGNAGKQK